MRFLKAVVLVITVDQISAMVVAGPQEICDDKWKIKMLEVEVIF